LHKDSIQKNKNIKKDLTTDEILLLRDPEKFTFKPYIPDRANGTLRSRTVEAKRIKINVNIEGEKRLIEAYVDQDPQIVAKKFILKSGIDPKY